MSSALKSLALALIVIASALSGGPVASPIHIPHPIQLTTEFG